MTDQSSLIRKIYAGFTLLLVLLIVVAVAGYVGFVRVVDRIEKADDVNRLVKSIYATRLLEGNDADARNAFEEWAHLLRAVFGSAAASVEASLNDWDFSAALQALGAAKADREELK